MNEFKKEVLLAETKKLLGAEKYNSNKAISVFSCEQLELVNFFLADGNSIHKSIHNMNLCIEYSRATIFTAIEIAYSLKDKEYLKNLEENRYKTGKSQKPLVSQKEFIGILDEHIEEKRMKEQNETLESALSDKKDLEKKILELNGKIFKISVMSICAILVLMISLMLYYTSAFDEGYKNGAKDTQKLYESITKNNHNE